MPSPHLPPALMNEVFRLPQPVLRAMMKGGLWHDEIEAYLHLVNSAALSDFPPALRRLRARDLVRGFLRGKDSGSHEAGFFPYLVRPAHWQRYPDLELRDGTAPAQTLVPVLTRAQGALPDPLPAIALHIHAYYLDDLAAVRRAIEVNTALPEVYITTSAAQITAAEQIFATYAAPCHIRTCRNIGRDVVPFLDLLPEMLTRDYALIGHVHLKKSLTSRASTFARQWTRYMVSSLIGDADRQVAAIDDILRNRTEHPDAALYMPHMMNHVGWAGNRGLADAIRRDLIAKGFALPPLPDRPLFSVGTMFWAVPDYLSLFTHITADWETTCAEPLADDATILHALERLFGAIAQSRGDKIVICPPVETRLVLSSRFMRKMKL